jgi:hypothetical protein
MAMGEIDDVHHAEDNGKANSDKRVGKAHQQAACGYLRDI